jgi:hypothetical protein
MGEKTLRGAKSRQMKGADPFHLFHTVNVSDSEGVSTLFLINLNYLFSFNGDT